MNRLVKVTVRPHKRVQDAPNHWYEAGETFSAKAEDARRWVYQGLVVAPGVNFPRIIGIYPPPTPVEPPMPFGIDDDED